MKEKIKGLIIVYSCNKHKNTRLKINKLKYSNYNGYKLFYIIGNPKIKDEYVLLKNFMIVKCEDSYIHLLKKVVKSMEILLNLYEIEEGIIRCGDDIKIDEERLMKFINSKKKYDYLGKQVDLLKIYKKKVMYNSFMYNYYKNHVDDFKNELHGLKKQNIESIKNMSLIPCVNYTGGVIYYISKKSVLILIKELKKINYDIFSSELIENLNTYPYIIEDIGVGYIMNKYDIVPSNYSLYADKEDEYKKNEYCFGMHTNYLK